MDEVLWEIGSNAAYCILPVAYCNGTWKKIRRKWQVMLPIAYFLLPIVMQHARSFGEMASNAAAKMTSKTAEQHRLCTQKRSVSLRSKPDLVLLQNCYFDVVQFLALPRQALLIAIKK